MRGERTNKKINNSSSLRHEEELVVAEYSFSPRFLLFALFKSTVFLKAKIFAAFPDKMVKQNQPGLRVRTKQSKHARHNALNDHKIT